MGQLALGSTRDFCSSGSEKAPRLVASSLEQPGGRETKAREKETPPGWAMRRGHGLQATELSNARGFHGLSCQAQREVEGRERACCDPPHCTVTALPR